VKKSKRLTLTIPPKKGPVPQGLKITYNNIKIIKTTKKGTSK
jgi:hypothetical protein|tara:strand:- start:718 stop:843 length:126 start_codon:yes stop_codon:yes gene_type:complete